jgi:nucleoside-triphosphatase THEP1
MLPNISGEQKQIITCLEDNYNVIVDAVAGSGKTTASLFLANYFSTKKILLLTYNAKLKIETREKTVKYNINNIEIHSYHSFGKAYYDNKCHKDEYLINIVKNDLPMIIKKNYDIIVLDEAQDICPLYYQFICKVLENTKKENKYCQMVILGDIYQSIYSYNGSDSRYIIYGSKVFNFDDTMIWKKLKLSYTFRVPIKICNFINNCLLKEERIKSNKKLGTVKYIICNMFSNFSYKPYVEIKYLLTTKRFKYRDIFVLAPSLKSENTPIKRLANLLTLNNIPIYVPTSDDEKLDDDVIKGKIVFSTFHQAKGLERKGVLVFGFDDSYFKYYNKTCSLDLCPNEIYVAVTRALKYLVVFHHYENNYFSFINLNKLQKFCTFDQIMSIKDTVLNSKTDITVGVTDFIKHLPINIIIKILTYFDEKIIQKENKNPVSIDHKSKQHKMYELVSDINGVAIPTYFEYLLTGKMSIYERLILSKHEFKKFEKDQQISIKNILYLSNEWLSYLSGYNFKVKQIHKYDWLNEKTALSFVEKIKKYISQNAIFEYQISMNGVEELRGRTLNGYIDCINNNEIWEFKCVSELTSEHKIQLACYMYQFLKKDNNKLFKFYLLNIITEEIIEITSTIEKLTQMIELISQYKFDTKIKISDEEFLNNNKN